MEIAHEPQRMHQTNVGESRIELTRPMCEIGAAGPVMMIIVQPFAGREQSQQP